MTYGQPHDYIIHGEPPNIYNENDGHGYYIAMLTGEAQIATITVLNDGNTWYIPSGDGENRPWYITDPHRNQDFILVEADEVGAWKQMQIEVAK